MKRSAVNPYLPLDEYVPDGEPRLFEGRLYLYGSHDTAGGNFFCLEDYVAWSAPENDLSNWRYEGVIYRKNQDPANPEGKLELFAPDVVQGADGRYYLYYCLRMLPEFGVAVSDSPAGPFKFYSHITRSDGSVLDSFMPYDPSVLVDTDGKVYLYYGFSSQVLAKKYGVEKSPGCMMVQLAPDMCTAVTEPVQCIPGEDLALGSSFEGHAYVEAPSMRRFGDQYYLVYSSQHWHELCYAVSDQPDKNFVYGGILVDNADLELNGNTHPVRQPGNNHGGLVEVDGRLYMFYHRHTQTNSYSRQGCAEAIAFRADGSLPQVEVTSCGLNDGPLPAQGEWPAAIACRLHGPDPDVLLDFRNLKPGGVPYITETGTGGPSPEQFIANLMDGAVVGYKYFRAENVRTVTVWVRGTQTGMVSLHLDTPDNSALGRAVLPVSESWVPVTIPASFEGTHALYFRFTGQGAAEFSRFSFDA